MALIDINNINLFPMQEKLIEQLADNWQTTILSSVNMSDIIDARFKPKVYVVKNYNDICSDIRERFKVLDL